MAGRLPKRRAEDQHSISSFFKFQSKRVSLRASEPVDDGDGGEKRRSGPASLEGMTVDEVLLDSDEDALAEPADEVSKSLPRRVEGAGMSYNHVVMKALSGQMCSDEEKRIILGGRTPPVEAELPFS